ncbi:hypothetical protein LTR56_021357 [Elasticomyces elasticus]|nr:hypothetical protein LTR56_021357 [Elasticomyces elasticus]KAK3631698.1 hypothetical protein LTR22_020988 [Elasticomyces elasticus]KAK4909543.1 hypothetical protein LTR49_021660 [Elasticomyces elasticus]KAK5754316.1 hypothetical protein LTS12_015607 [Elasticomyces elasticus]
MTKETTATEPDDRQTSAISQLTNSTYTNSQYTIMDSQTFFDQATFAAVPTTTPSTPVQKQNRRGKRSAVKGWAKRMAKTLRNAFSFSSKTKKSPTKSRSTKFEKSPLGSSKRSSISQRLTRMTHHHTNKPIRPTLPLPTTSQLFGSSSAISLPEVITTSPSGKRYTIHSYAGPSSPELEPAPIRQSVRIAHPATSAVMPVPPSPSVASVDSWDEGDEKHFSISSSNMPTPSDELTSFVNPKQIFRMSFQGTQIEGTSEDFDRFMNNLDGFKKQVEARITAPASETTDSSALPYISKTPSLTDDDASDWETITSVDTETKENRDQTLQVLMGNAEANYSCPSILQPGKPQPPVQRKPLVHRPATIGTSGLYVSFKEGAFGAFDPFDPETPKRASTTPSDSTDRPSTPKFFATTEQHRAHVNRVESCVFDEPSRPSTPDYSGDSVTHRQLSQVESGLFYFAPNSPRSSGAPELPVSPPSPPQTVKPLPKQIPRKAVNYSKPLAEKPLIDVNKALPLVPSPRNPKRYTDGVVPPVLTMNDSGFPVMARKAVRDSEVPASRSAMYKQRTLSADEMKIKKRAEGKKEQKIVREQKQKITSMTAAMGKLLVCGPQ